MSLRVDSRGEPIKRAIIGDKEIYRSIVYEKNEKKRKLEIKSKLEN